MSYYFRQKSLGKKKKERTRSALMDSVITEIAENGFNNLSIKDVSSVAGLANGTFYNHFQTIDELVVAAVTAVTTEVVEDIAKVTADIDHGLERFVVSTNRLLQFLFKEPGWGNIFVGAWHNIPQYREDTSRFLRADLVKAKSQGSISVEITPLLEEQIITVIVLCITRQMRGDADENALVHTLEAVLRLLGLSPTQAAKTVNTILTKYS